MADFTSIVIDHLNIGVSDLDRALPIYEAALSAAEAVRGKPIATMVPR